MLHRRTEAGPSARNADAVRTAFREMFFHLIRELFDAIGAHLGEPEAPIQLYEFLARYFSVAHEAFLNINHRSSAVVLRAVLDAVGRTPLRVPQGAPDRVEDRPKCSTSSACASCARWGTLYKSHESHRPA